MKSEFLLRRDIYRKDKEIETQCTAIQWYHEKPVYQTCCKYLVETLKNSRIILWSSLCLPTAGSAADVGAHVGYVMWCDVMWCDVGGWDSHFVPVTLCFNSSRPRWNVRYNTDDIFRCIFLKKKMFEFRLKFHWSLFPRVQLTIFQYWFR